MNPARLTIPEGNSVRRSSLVRTPMGGSMQACSPRGYASFLCQILYYVSSTFLPLFPSNPNCCATAFGPFLSISLLLLKPQG